MSASAHLAIVTTWNQRCGIAAYSRYLSERFPSGQWSVFAPMNAERTAVDEPHVRRCWRQGQHDPLDDLFEALTEQNATHVLIQFNFSFFHLRALARLIVRLRRRGVVPVVTLHATQDVPPQHGFKSLREIRDALAQARLLVHGLADIQRLHAWGLEARLFPHGVVQPPSRLVQTPLENTMQSWLDRQARIVASYGFLLPHKGIPELVSAFERLRPDHPELRLLLLNAEYPAPVSAALAQQLHQRIRRSRHGRDICLYSAYTRDDEALSLLSRVDMVVLPYQDTQESSSAAARFALAANRPVLVTPLAIFDDVRDQVIPLSGTHPEQLAAGIRQQLADPQPVPPTRAGWLRDHRWSTLSERLWRAIVRPPLMEL